MHEITNAEARAIKHADTLCFDHHADGTGCIRAIQSADNSPSGFEQTITVEATSSRVNNYGPQADAFTGFSHCGSAKFSDVARTLVRHLRPGSQFTMRWTRDNSSPITRDAGLYVDLLHLTVQHGRTTDCFLVDYSVGLDNSARMIRVA